MKILALLLVFLVSIDAAKILIMMSFESKSHKNIHEATAIALGSKGHKVSLFTPYPMAKQWPNVEWFRIGEEHDSGPNLFDIYESRKETMMSMMLGLTDFLVTTCDDLYTQPKLKSLLEESQKRGKLFDVAIVDSLFSEYALPLASLLANHTIFLSVLPTPSWIAIDFRIPYPLSTLSSSAFSHFSSPITFWQRLENFVGATAFLLLRNYHSLPTMQKAVLKYVPPNAPSISEALKNVNFILTNEDAVMSPSRPSVPFVAAIGGIHLKNAQPLPKDLEDFMQSSGEHGVILFSFGSFFDTRLMPIKMRDHFVAAFARLKQKIIWKYHEPIEGISNNVKIVSWMPQTDILGHPKLRLFITHGGCLSSREIVYHGVPMIGIALFFDQIHNIARLKEVGIGLEIDILDITEDRIYESVMTIINNRSYAENGKQLSAIFRDTQNSPVETVNYWVEYVVRHNGAAHLKNELAQTLSFYQYLLLDVLAVIVLAVIATVFIFIFIIRLSLKLFFETKNKTKKNKKD